MKPAIFLFAACLLVCAQAEDSQPASKMITTHLRFEDGLGRFTWTSELTMTRETGIDSDVIEIRPQEDQPPWKMTLVVTAYPKTPKPMPDRTLDWRPFGQPVTLLIHRNPNGSAWGEAMAKTGRDLIPDDKTGVLTHVGDPMQIHLMMWFATEAAIEPTLAALEITKVPFPQAAPLSPGKPPSTP